MISKNNKQKELKKKIKKLSSTAHEPENREILVTYFEGTFQWSEEALAWLGIKAAEMMMGREESYIGVALNLGNFIFTCDYDDDGVWIDVSALEVAMRISKTGSIHVDG